jgi:hypothetical protein
VSLYYVLLPALLVHVDSAFGTVIDTSPGLFPTDRTFHYSVPPLSFPFDPSGLAIFLFASRESVT